MRALALLTKTYHGSRVTGEVLFEVMDGIGVYQELIGYPA